MANPLSDLASIATIVEAIAVIASVLFIVYQAETKYQSGKGSKYTSIGGTLGTIQLTRSYRIGR